MIRCKYINISRFRKDSSIITEKDFYPPGDDRLYDSGIDDINGGDTFEGYSKWFWRNYEDEIFDNK